MSIRPEAVSDAGDDDDARLSCLPSERVSTIANAFERRRMSWTISLQPDNISSGAVALL